eukprot:COSAG01_NODE_22584_length_849_cov_18.581333_1_plen_144_part_00
MYGLHQQPPQSPQMRWPQSQCWRLRARMAVCHLPAHTFRSHCELAWSSDGAQTAGKRDNNSSLAGTAAVWDFLSRDPYSYYEYEYGVRVQYEYESSTSTAVRVEYEYESSTSTSTRRVRVSTSTSTSIDVGILLVQYSIPPPH